MDKFQILFGIVKGKPISRKLLVQLVTSVLVFAGSYALQKFGLDSNPAYRSDVSFAAAQVAGLVVAWATREWPSLLGAAAPVKPVKATHVRIPISGTAPAPDSVPAPISPPGAIVTPAAIAPMAEPAPRPIPHAWTKPVEQSDGHPAEQGPRTITG